ncbi:MAG: T9SS type A sorting domain-containing protein, partial [Bacteroidota bacterium]
LHRVNDTLVPADSIQGIKPLIQALAFRLELYQSGVLVDEKIAYLYPGAQDTLFADDFEQNLNQWLYPLDAIRWDQSVIDPVQGSFCLADSKYGNYGSQKSLFLFLAQGLDLSQTFAPYLSFQAQWSLEPGQDSVRLEGLDATGHWIPLQSFTGHQAWKEIRIDLDAFRHPNFRIRFHLRSNPLVQGDGIYLDQFRIIDFLPTAISNLEEMEDWQVVLGPNPVEDALHLKIGTRRNGPLEIRLWDMKGSAILRSQIEKSPSGFYEARFSVQHLAAGIYSLELKTEQGRRMYKIWKK